MPFIGRDWRSPGEAWVKTESLGWQRMKIIESQLHPSYHHQTNPACSWPPRSEFGQHMANHCKEHSSDRNSNSSEFRGDSFSSSSSSDCGSRGNSISPSPTGSPEKNMHHIYPITISSPYGQYSCCSHHLMDQPPGSPRAVSRNYHRQTSANGSEETGGSNNNNSIAQSTLSRSLSRESALVDSTNNKGNMGGLRYNNSVSDFRDISPSLLSTSDNNKAQQQNDLNNEKSNNDNDLENMKPSNDIGLNTPILMRNGQKMDCDKREESNQGSMDDQLAANQQENQLNGTCCCAHHNHQNIYQSKEPYVRTAPHCRISVRTREVAMYNTISEAFYRLDFCNAIHDIRRFNYICKLLHLLITQNLTSLSGCATKVLFTMLEQVAWEVSSNKRNIHVLKNLLNELKQMIQKYYCWGRPIGSSLLWQQHFDTIERISQMVDSIELSPTKSEQEHGITFNNLPVEMIREILLRLNDYRDLVNSAQASPVMRNMIDGQYIWQQLCRYHFTEQQLKLALDNGTNGMFTKPPQARNNGSSVRGLKYAKTASADGRTSFRNPVPHQKSKSSSSSSSNSNTTRQQLEQTSGRRNSRQKDLPASSEQATGSSSSSSSSYVTRAIRIFDKEGGSTKVANSSNGSTRAKKTEKSESSSKVAVKQQQSKQEVEKNKDQNKIGQQQNRPSNSNRSSHEIDWERVFHQLRKKFDLKEEYADCLLLCRHCRCLFWKSFGHPCIKNDDDSSSMANHQRYPSSGLRLDHQPTCSLAQGQNSCNCGGLSQFHGGGGGGADDGLNGGRRLDHSAAQNSSRVSVAALSRNFDGRARNMDNLENQAPLGLEQQQHNNDGPQAYNLQRQNLNDNLEAARLRGRFVRLVGANRQRLDNEINDGNNNNGNNLSTTRRNELIPKHVAVSPQAFLKFFSL